MKQNYSLNNTCGLSKVILLCSLFVNAAFGQVNNTTSKSEKSSLNHPAATAQDMNVRQAEMSRTAKSGENSATTAASELQLNADRPAELAEFEAKINTLLTLVRAALMVDTNKAKFHETLEQPIRIKSDQACPSIALMDLINGSAPFTASPEIGKQELSYAVDLLSNALSELSAN